MKIVNIIGRKNNGKTTLVVALLEAFNARGLCVGSIKHTSHSYDLDTPGKDSDRHRHAGARPAAIISGCHTAVHLPTPKNDTRCYDHIMSLYADCDFIVVEGHCAGPGIKLEVWRKEANTEPIAATQNDVVAMITDDHCEIDLPTIPRHDVSKVVDKILRLLDMAPTI
jgi:molybdopterin-guanine dinucleotide biosynthesis protein MobB